MYWYYWLIIYGIHWDILPKVRDPTSQQFHAALLGRGFVEVGPSLVLATSSAEVKKKSRHFKLRLIRLGDSSNQVYPTMRYPKSKGSIIILQGSRFHSGFVCLACPEIETQQALLFIGMDIHHFKPHWSKDIHSKNPSPHLAKMNFISICQCGLIFRFQSPWLWTCFSFPKPFLWFPGSNHVSADFDILNFQVEVHLKIIRSISF